MLMYVGIIQWMFPYHLMSCLTLFSKPQFYNNFTFDATRKYGPLKYIENELIHQSWPEERRAEPTKGDPFQSFSQQSFSRSSPFQNTSTPFQVDSRVQLPQSRSRHCRDPDCLLYDHTITAIIIILLIIVSCFIIKTSYISSKAWR